MVISERVVCTKIDIYVFIIRETCRAFLMQALEVRSLSEMQF
jgi:hypothetical protein